MLKSLFSSNTRVKLLQIFLLNTEEEYFIRELTRKIDEQINSVRRELDNLKKIGLLKARNKNRKKFYHVNKDFILFTELKSIITKCFNSEHNISKYLNTLGDIEVLIFTGVFVDNKNSKVDIIIIGDINKLKLENFLKKELRRDDIRYSIISKEDFIYRLNFKDRFISEILNDNNNLITINKLKSYIRKNK